MIKSINLLLLSNTWKMFNSYRKERKFFLDMVKYYHSIFVNICPNHVKNTYNITVLPKNKLSSNHIIDFRNENGDLPDENGDLHDEIT